MDIKEDQPEWFTGFLIKKSTVSGIKNEINQNQQLANELHKPIIRKFKKRKVYLPFKDNIWGVDLADKGIRYLLCVMDLFSKYAWVVPLKDKKGVSIVNAFQKILDSSKRKSNEIWVDQGSDQGNSTIICLKSF